MKKVLSWVLLLTLIVSLFAGCKTEEVPETTAPTEGGSNVSQGDVEGITAALEYLKVMYKTTEEATPTPRDYQRLGIVRIGGVPYEVVWTTDLSEEMIQVVVNDDGTVTIKILQQPEEDIPYKLTATITDSEGNSVSYSWEMVLPKAVDMAAIVDAAYELGNGETLPYEATLTGKIISIDTVYDPDYQNITVTMVVEGKEDKPIKCYRLKGVGAENLMVGNIITVTGTIKNYNGTIEFDAGCILEAVEKGDAVEAPTDPGEILKAAYALKENQTLPYPAVLTGKVIAIDSPYDPNYGNISVIIEVEGYSQYPILCYRLKGLGVDQIAIEDIITVNGIIKNYKGTIEYDTGCKLVERISGGNIAEKPSSDPNKIIPDAMALAPGQSLAYRATLTGTIYSIDTPYSSQYNNITVTMVVNGYKFQCYRMVGDGIDQIRETDKITVSGIIKNYNGKIEFDAKCTLDAWEKGPRNVSYGPVKEGVAYALYMDQKTVGKTVYFNGAVSGNRLQTSDKGSKAIEVYGERVSGKGMRFYYMEGNAKKYIQIEEYVNDEGKVRGRAIVTDSPSCVWTYLNDMGVYVVSLPTAGKYFLGTYSSYETITASWSGYLESSSNPQYVAKFMEHSKVPVSEPATMIPEGTPVDAPAVGTAYKFGFYQNKLEGKPFLAFAGKMSGYYMATANVMADMTDVYLETAQGGYYIYFKNGNTKTYIDMIVRESDNTKVDIKLQTSGTHTVWKLNLEHKYVYSSLAGSEWYLGTFNTNNSISASKTSYISDTSTIGVSQFCAWFNNVKEVPAPEEEPDEPVVPDVPAVNATVVTAPQAGVAYKLGLDKGDGPLFFTGNTESASVTYRLETNPDATKAVDVYLEAVSGVSGGYRLYFMNGNTKTYIRVFHRTDDAEGRPGFGKGSLEFVTAAPTEYYTYDTTAKTLFHKASANDSYYMGTYGDYVTVSVSNTSYITGNKASAVDVSQFPVRFYTVETSDTPDVSEPTTTVPPVTQPTPEAEATLVTNPGFDTAYKMAMDKKDGKLLYFNGLTESATVTYRLQTTENAAEAVDVYLENAGSGNVWLYFMNGNTKTYIRVFHRTDDAEGRPGFGKGSLEFVTSKPNETFVYDDTANTLFHVASANDSYYLGTYGTYTTFSVSNTSYITGDKASNVDVSQFPARFYTVEIEDVPVVTDPPVTNPPATEPSATEPPVADSDPILVTNPAAGVAYKMAMDKAGTMLYFNGLTESASVTYRLQTTENAAEAVDVYLEDAGNGNVWLYFMNGNTKTYIRVFHRTDDAEGRPGYGKGSLEFVTSKPNETFVYDDTANTLFHVASANDSYYLGTYGTYTTFSVSNTSYITGDKASNVDVSQFPARFYTVEISDTPDVTEPTVTNPPATEPPASEPTGNGYHKITSASQFTSGKYVMMVATGYAPGVYQSGWLSAVQPAVSGNTVTDPAGAVWTLTVDGNSVILTDSNGVAIAPKGGNSNGVSEGSYEWKWTFENGAFRFAGTGSDTVYLASNTTTTGQYPGNHRFRGYKVTTCNDAATYPSLFTLYKLSDGTDIPDVSEPTVTNPPATEPPVSGGEATMVTNPAFDTAYKMAMDKKDGKLLYFNGMTESASVTYRLATTENAAEAVDVYLENAGNGNVYLYFMNGNTKTYIRVFHRTDDAEGRPGYGKGSLEFVTSKPSETFVYDDTANTLFHVASANDSYYLGTYGTYTTFSVSNTSYITGNKASTVDVSQFPARFYEVSGSSEPAPSEPAVTNPPATEPPATEPPATEPPVVSGSYVTSPVAGKAYKMAMDKAGKVLYFNGLTESASVTYRLATTENAAEAVDVYLEDAGNGNVYLYFMNGNTKTYIRVFHRTDDAEGRPGYGKGSLEFVTSKPSETFVYDDTANTLFHVASANDSYYLGTYGTYTTFSVSNTSYITGNNAANVDVSQFPARFYEVSGGSEEPPVTEPEGEVYNVVSGKNLDIKLEHEGNLESLSFEYKMTDGTMNIALTMPSNKNVYYGYFAFDGHGNVSRYDGITVETLSDGYFRVTMDIAAMNKVSGTPDGSVDTLYVYGMWTDGNGVIRNVVLTAEEETPAAGNTVTYNFANYAEGTQYASEVRQLDDVVTISTSQCQIKNQLRIYQDLNYNANAVFASTKAIKSVIINAGYKVAGLEVYGSDDGVTWKLITTVNISSTTYGDYTVEMPAGTSYKYLKLDAVNAQVRVPYITFNFA